MYYIYRIFHMSEQLLFTPSWMSLMNFGICAAFGECSLFILFPIYFLELFADFLREGSTSIPRGVSNKA